MARRIKLTRLESSHYDTARSLVADLDWVPTDEQIGAAIARDIYLLDDLRYRGEWTQGTGIRLRRALQRNQKGVPRGDLAYTRNKWINWEYNDGGRVAAGFLKPAGDCVLRAIAIATRLPYREIHDDFVEAWTAVWAEFPEEKRQEVVVDDGLPRPFYENYLLRKCGWYWTPTMGIGTGCTVHLRRSELPWSRCIVRLSGHLAAVEKGTVYDTYDPSREGTRCVYGVFTPFEWRR